MAGRGEDPVLAEGRLAGRMREPLPPEPYWRVAQYADTIDNAWSDSERYRMLISDLPRRFHQSSRELQWHHVRAHIYVIGGAAMALGFDNRRQTMDVDALIKSGHGPVVEAVRRIGRRRGWPETWLNEEAVSAMPRGRDGGARTVYGDRNLVVTAASAEHLLAMKVRAARPKDQEDIAFLARRLGLSSAREVVDLHDKVFPRDPPQTRSFEDACKILRDLWPHDRSLERDDRYGYGLERGRGSAGLSR